MNQNDIDHAWFNFQALPGIAFKLNDTVRIVNGEHQDMLGTVIALSQRHPEPLYRVELGATGSELELPESLLNFNPE